jgi:hypothetical protein
MDGLVIYHLGQRVWHIYGTPTKDFSTKVFLAILSALLMQLFGRLAIAREHLAHTIGEGSGEFSP